MGNLTHTVSGDIANFRSAARVPIESLKCHFKPVQDLHGYSKPWIGGSGKNLFDESTIIYGTWTADNGTINLVSSPAGCRTPDIETTAGEIYTIFFNGNRPYSASVIELDENKNFLLRTHKQWADVSSPSALTVTIGTNTKYFYAQVANLNSPKEITSDILASYKIQLEKGSTATSYEPYENICPITGWTDLESYNITSDYDIQYLTGTTTSYNVTFIRNANGYVTATGTPTSYSSCHYGIIDVEGNETIYGTIFGSLNNITFNKPTLYDSSGQEITTTLADNALHQGINLSQFPGVKKVQINMKRSLNNVYMSGGFRVVIGKNRKIAVTTIPITFPITGKNKFNWDVEFVNPDVTATTSASKRIFQPYTYCIGGSYSNYFMPIAVESYNIENGIISVKRTTGYSVYGVSYALPLISGQTYYLSCTAVSGFIHTAFYDEEGNYLTGSSKNYSNFSFTVPNNATIGVFNFIPSNTTDIATFSNIQIELGNTTTEYTEFSGNNTIYGGYVDIAAGEVVAEYISKSVTWGSIKTNNPNATTGIDFGYVVFDYPIMYTTAGATATNSFCNICKYSWNGKEYAVPHFYPGIRSGQTGNEIYLPSTTDDNTIIQSVVKLATPIHYPLSKQELNTYLNQNNYWSNTNDITEVSYQIHDSNMIQQAKKRMLAENELHHYRKVLWNQMVNGYLTADDWKNYNDNYTSLTFANGIATVDFFNSNGTYYTMTTKAQPQVYLSHQYYYYIEQKNDNNSTYAGTEFAGGRQTGVEGIALSDGWYKHSGIQPGNRDGNGAMYIPFYYASAGIYGHTAQVRNPLYVDLTAMFGPGNEPSTTEEFEYLCQINNVDFSTPHTQDAGTEQIWCIPNYNRDKYITVEWNQKCRPLNSTYYKPQNTDYISTSVDNNDVMTITVLQDVEQPYQTAVISYYNVAWYTDHIYYYKQELKSSKHTTYTLIYRSKWGKSLTVLENTWETLEYINTPDSPNMSSSLFLAYCTEKSIGGKAGTTCQLRDPIFIDLTQMFGAGNEPSTVAELRAMCLKNNIDLDNALPYNAGQRVIWKV